MPPVKPTYSVTGLIGADDMTAHVIVDKKNSSIHLHFYGEMFGNERTPISVKHTNMKFLEGDDAAVVKETINGEFPNKKVQINKVTLMKEKEAHGQNGHSHRVIIRFKK